MGIPGASEREMSSALSDNHSPASAEEIQKPPQQQTESAAAGLLAASSFNGGSNSNHLASPQGSKAAADLSSDDIDVTSTNDYEQKPLAQARPPEPNLAERLKRLRTYVISPLFKHVKSTAFREPVNAKALGIYPAYHQIIKQPMDLGTIRKKIDRGEYRSRAECIDDINLVWHNAKTFNAPGHFVHEAARILEAVTRDKVAKLEKDEADGIFSQPKQPPAAKKIPDTLARVIGQPDTPAAVPRPERRTARKVSQDLPGESAQPQQLKKKYVENLSDQMKQCDAILKELMTVKLHQGYVEPFRHVSRKYKGDNYDPMDLFKIQNRLQSNFYRHPLQFGNDFRRMITETYRFNHPKDPIIAQASNLQHNFELLFSRVMYEPVENPAAYDITNEDDSMLSHLMAAQTQVLTIQNSVAELLRDLIKMRASKLKSKGGNVKKRGRAASATGPSPATKKPRVQQQQQPKQPASKMQQLTPEESLALRAEVADLDEDQQQQVVQIMMDNHEAVTTDANGYTEIDLGSCGAKTVQLIQAFIKKVKTKKVSPAKAKKKPVAAAPAPAASPVKTPKKEAGNLSDSSSDSSDSSSSSSSSDSDSE